MRMADELSWYPEGDWSLDAEWYQFADGGLLRQCDILRGCPVIRVAGKLEWPIDTSVPVPIKFDKYDLIVLTQSCDLDNDKVDDVLLAQVSPWPEVVEHGLQRNNHIVKKREFRRAIINGNVPGQALLHKHERDPQLDWSIVIFQRLFTIQKEFLNAFASSVGPRLRIRSPYREHIAQAFARFVMRVGLPFNAKAFESEGDLKF